MQARQPPSDRVFMDQAVQIVVSEIESLERRVRAFSEFSSEPPLHTRDFRATLRVTPVVDGNRAFVEWWTTFDCDLERQNERTAFFRDAFAGWLESLRRHLERRAKAA